MGGVVTSDGLGLGFDARLSAAEKDDAGPEARIVTAGDNGREPHAKSSTRESRWLAHDDMNYVRKVYNRILRGIDVEDSELVSNPLDDGYAHVSFTARNRPDLHNYALHIHAEGYVSKRIVQTSALTSNGVLVGAGDEFRGENVEYYLSINPANAQDAATLRKISLPLGADHTYLPAYIHSQGSLWEEGLSIIENLPNKGDRLKEISAMSRTKASRPLSMLATVRDVFNQSIGKGEIWLCSLLVPTYEVLVSNLGEHCFRVIGDDVSIDDGKANPDMKFRPVLFEPDGGLSVMLADYRNATDPNIRRRLLRTFIFFNHGIPDELKEPEVSSFFHDAYDKFVRSVQKS